MKYLHNSHGSVDGTRKMDNINLLGWILWFFLLFRIFQVSFKFHPSTCCPTLEDYQMMFVFTEMNLLSIKPMVIWMLLGHTD